MGSTLNREINEVKPYLPKEIIGEILSLLPAKCVVRYVSVCKQWHALIKEQHFLDKHHMHHQKPTVSTFSPVRKPESSSANQAAFETLHRGYGLIVERSNNNGNPKYRIRNPATRAVLNLPCPLYSTNHVMFLCKCKTFVASDSTVYKLLSFHGREGRNREGGCQILTLGSDDLSWRSIDIRVLHDFDLEKDDYWFKFLSNDLFHWVRICKESSSNTAEVVTINLKDEEFCTNRLPRGSFSNRRNIQVLIWRGKLAFGEIVNKQLHVLVPQDYSKTTFPLEFIKRGEHVKIESVSFRNNYVSVVKKSELVYYDLEGKIMKIVAPEDAGSEFSLLNFTGMQQQQTSRLLLGSHSLSQLSYQCFCRCFG